MNDNEMGRLIQAATTSPEWHKMLSGEVYDAMEENIIALLNVVKTRVAAFNAISPTDYAGKEAALQSILRHCGENPRINQPFYCDYGINISVGNNFFANFGLTILDEAPVSFGDNVFIGPGCGFFTPCHPTDVDARNAMVQWAKPITVGNNVWIGGNCTILPGVSIGDGCTIGAGSVVVRDIPAGTVAVGNPCRPVKNL
ncbi:MAG: sugar O-acetyltransferase [Muribaculaceae bacterium]